MTAGNIYRIKTAVCVAALCIAGLAGTALAQEQEAADARQGLPDSYSGPASAVAAVVKDGVITTTEVAQRTRLMAISSGREVPPEFMQQLQARALRDLIEERLKLLEGQQFEVEIDNREIDEELQFVAAQGNLTIAQLEEALAQQGGSLSSLRQQIRANKIWTRLVQGRYGSRVKVSQDEVETTLERMREDATSEQYLVSEICIPVPRPAEAQQMYEGSLQLIEQLRRGVPFAVVAQQFSACTSAAAGGDLGWVRSGELPPELDEVIRDLPAGSVTNPIPSDGAFMIMAVRDKREATVAGEQSYTLAYASAPLEMGRNAALLSLEKLKTAEACGGRARRQDLGENLGVALIENAKLDAIDDRFRDHIEGLNRGDLSGAIEADGYLHIAYVCEKDEGLGLPSRDALEDRIYSRQLERIAQQYLRDVERKTLVDVRLRPQQQQRPNG